MPPADGSVGKSFPICSVPVVRTSTVCSASSRVSSYPGAREASRETLLVSTGPLSGAHGILIVAGGRGKYSCEMRSFDDYAPDAAAASLRT